VVSSKRGCRLQTGLQVPSTAAHPIHYTQRSVRPVADLLQAKPYSGGASLKDIANSTEAPALDNAAVPLHTARPQVQGGQCPHPASAHIASKLAGRLMAAISFCESQTYPASAMKTATSHQRLVSSQKPLSLMSKSLQETQPAKPQLQCLRLLPHTPHPELSCTLPRSKATSKTLGRR